MSCESRFKTVENAGFPAVKIYTYEDNLPTRGTADRVFRWEEVCLDSTYLFTEVTRSGNFEENHYTGNPVFHGGHAAVIPHASGRITSGDATATGVFDGWFVSGNATFYLSDGSETGYSVFTGGSYPGITSEFKAYSIEGTGAIGLFPYDGGTVAGIPQIRSHDLYSGETGTHTGRAMQNNERYQFYLQTFVPFGTTAGIRTIVEATDDNGNSEYYNPRDRIWQSGALTTGSHWRITRNTLTEIKYDFGTSGFQSPTFAPTGYRIMVESETTGNFIVIDDVHVDKYGAKNEFVDFILPTGYMIQITPDLGWHDTQGMFEDRGGIANPHLKTFGPYSLVSGNLIDRLDGSVSATMTSGDFNEATYNPYTKYLWRALAISPNSNSLGLGGYPARFDFIGRILDEDFSVTEVFNDPLSVVKVICGTRTPRMELLVDERAHPGTEYPTETTWRLTINMDRSHMQIEVRGKDKGGTKSSKQIIDLSSEVHLQTEKSLWNTFDEHGLLMHLPRLPQETNLEYKTRIKDVHRSPGGNNFQGVVNGGTRELGLDRISDSLRFSIPLDYRGQGIHSSVRVEVTSASVRVRTPTMIITETVQVDPIFRTVDLSKLPAEFPDFIETVGGSRIESDKVSLSPDMDDDDTLYRLEFAEGCDLGNHITLRYEYWEEVLFRKNPSMGEVAVALDLLADGGGTQLLEVSLSPVMAGNEDPFGLYISDIQVSPDQESFAGWSPMFVRRVSDRNFRRHFRSDDGTYWNTKFYEYVQELKANTNVFWGFVEADRDFWDAADSADEGFDDIPTLMDPPLSYYTTTTGYGTSPVRLMPEEVWFRAGRGYLDDILTNRGLEFDDFVPGVAHTHDLEPSVYTAFSVSAEAETQASFISAVNQSSTGIIFFSGQVQI